MAVDGHGLGDGGVESAASSASPESEWLGIFVSLFAGMGLVLLPVPVVFYLMGCLVITVQTLVFCLLSVIYITLAIQHEEEH